MLYRCYIRGENFPGSLIGKPGVCGFYTTRWVDAETPEDAERLALQALKADPSFDAGDLPEMKTNNARVFFEEILAVDPETPRLGGKGATWFQD